MEYKDKSVSYTHLQATEQKMTPQIKPVSYTHLDVYKRQLQCLAQVSVRIN